MAILEGESARLAYALRELGLREGDRLGCGFQRSGVACDLLACARLGAIAVSINTRFKSHESPTSLNAPAVDCSSTGLDSEKSILIKS